MDPFQQFASWDEQTALGWATGLDKRAATATQAALRADAVAAAQLAPGDVVVEVGCGTGPMLGDLADAVGPTGLVLGLEPQRTLARVAAQRLGSRAALGLASGTALPVRDGVAAAALASTVLLHVPAAEQVAMLVEMARVVRPGGRVLSVDQDMEGWVIDHPDRETTRRLLRFNVENRYGDGWTGRRLPTLFRAAGLRDISVQALTHVDTSPGTHLHGNAQRMAAAAAEAGFLTPAEADAWSAGLDQDGHFFSALTYFRCAATVWTHV
jgi:ubiquinone/menaquinone biosynthesis C-methylase UbiE